MKTDIIAIRKIKAIVKNIMKKKIVKILKKMKAMKKQVKHIRVNLGEIIIKIILTKVQKKSILNPIKRNIILPNIQVQVHIIDLKI
jgi:hypothetical protein